MGAPGLSPVFFFGPGVTGRTWSYTFPWAFQGSEEGRDAVSYAPRKSRTATALIMIPARSADSAEGSVCLVLFTPMAP